MEISGTGAGRPIVFEMRPARGWTERIFREERDCQDAR